MIRLMIVSMARPFPLQRDAALPGCRCRPTLPCERQTKGLRVVGLIGRTRGSTASLHEHQLYTSISEAVPALGCMALARLTHTSMSRRSGCGIKRDRFCTQACAECITGP